MAEPFRFAGGLGVRNKWCGRTIQVIVKDYNPYGSKYLPRKCLGYDLGVKYLLRQFLDP